MKRLKDVERFNLNTIKKMGIVPETVKSKIKDILSSIYERDYFTPDVVQEEVEEYEPSEETLKKLEAEMKHAAENLEFERAAKIRDKIFKIKEKILKLGLKT